MEKITGARFRPTATWRTLSAPFEWMPRWLNSYGDPFLIRSFNGDVVVTRTREGIRSIFRAPSAQYTPFAAGALKPLTGPASLLVTAGTQHTRQRKLLMPPFHGDRMRAYAELMRDRATAEYTRVAGSPTGFSTVAEQISLGVIIRAVFGVTEPARAAEFADAILAFANSFHPAFSFMRFVQAPWFPPWRRFQRARERFDALMDAQIEVARGATDAEDVLHLMVTATDEDGHGMDDAEIKSQLITLLFAGYETTSITMTWMIDEIWRRPDVRAALRAEVDAVPAGAPAIDDTSLPYLDAVIKETLRLHPVITEVLRTLESPLEIEGHTIPAGKAVSASILLAHLDPDRYENPHDFRPERFLNQSRGPFDFLPFGGGHRRCIGAAFSMFEMKISIATLVRHYDVTLHDPAAPIPARKNLVFAPNSEIPVTLTPRKVG